MCECPEQASCTLNLFSKPDVYFDDCNTLDLVLHRGMFLMRQVVPAKRNLVYEFQPDLLDWSCSYLKFIVQDIEVNP